MTFVVSGCMAFAQPREAIETGDRAEQGVKGGDDALQHELWFRSGRQAKSGNSAALLYRAYKQKMAMQQHDAAALRTQRSSDGTFATPGTGPAWTNLGPAPMTSESGQDYGSNTGRITSVAVDQSDVTGNTVYIGGAFGGLWKSTNAAASDPTTVTWTPLIDAQPTLAVGAISIKPDDNKTLLVGTGEPNASVDSYYGLGILRSADGGATWNLIRTANGGGIAFLGLAFSKIVFNPDNTNQVVAGATSSNSASVGITTAARRGIYFSNDAGLTWRSASILDGTNPIAPDSPTSIVYNPVQHKFFAAIRRHGFYSSSDGGATWTRLTNQPQTVLTPGTVIDLNSCPTSPGLTSCPMFRGALAMRAGTTDEMYTIFVDSNEKDQGVFRTMDGGATPWTPLGVSGLMNCGDSNGCDTAQGFYNLELAALPAGAGNTNLVLGAVNLFKCSITPSSPTCGLPGPAWKNLTHVYGCNPAKVHPDQHAIAFASASSGTVTTVYFGNDGGIYRSLDGVAADGSCPGPTGSFQNLNTSLSLSEFVWFTQDKTTVARVLGGMQDNGTATTDGTNPWKRVNGGDGGYTDIDRNSPNIWYAENPADKNVSIQRCTAAPACTSDLFPEVITKTQLGGDTGPFYTPFMLDPQNTANILVGTCRLWRGPGTGVGFTAANALTNNLDTGTATVCSGSEKNTIGAIAAGGPSTANGSQVVYVGTRSGDVFVSTSADGGPATFAERMPPNPNRFPISSIAIDPADATGKTAYITVMGFATAHVIKTTTAGASWTDITANLPDAPADSVLVDPDNPKSIFVGTDTGVYLSPDGGASWSVYGNGLPSVPVTRLDLFKGGASKLLRASTYGRGVWSVSIVGPLVTTTTTLTSSANPAPVTTPITFTATVVPASGTVNPSGTVTFQETTSKGTVTLGTGTVSATGQATFTTSTLAGGTHSITAVYSGDNAFATSSSSPPLIQVVNTGSTATTTFLTSSANPSNFGDSVTFTANIGTSIPAGVPTGNVVFNDGSTLLATVPVNGSSQASFSTFLLAGGSHTITAVYSGDATYASSSSTLTQTVNQLTTSTLVASANNPAVFGSRVTLNATVTSSNPRAGTPTGTVSFNDGSNSLGTAALGGDGTANFPTSALTAGTHSITAKYVGDVNFAASTSPAISQVITQASSTTNLFSSVNPAGFGTSVTFTATISTPTGAPTTGTVTFKDGATALGAPVTVTGTTAMVSTSSLSAGSHVITAVYSGDANVTGSTSAPLTQTITVNNTNVALTSSSNPANAGASVTFTATVTAPGGGTPTGTVTFNDGAMALGAGTLNASGVATFSNTFLAAGVHSITAVYAGDSKFTGSTSPALNQSTSDYTLTANPPSATIRAGQSATFTVTLTPNNGFNSALTLTCTGLPQFSLCNFTPATLTPNGAAVTSTLIVSTSGPNAALQMPGSTTNGPTYAMLWSLGGGGVLGLVLLGGIPHGRTSKGSKRRWIALLTLTLALLLAFIMVGCGGGSSAPPPPVKPNVTPAGTSTVNAFATGSASPAHVVNLTLTVNP